MDRRILDGWKEIAEYVGKSIRTIQRWEKENGFPIRRVKSKRSVFAYPEEIDKWLSNKKEEKQEQQKQEIEKKEEKVGIEKTDSENSNKINFFPAGYFLFILFIIAVLFQAYRFSENDRIEKLKNRKLCYRVEANGAILNITDQYGKILKTFKSELSIYRNFAFDQKSRTTIKFYDLNGDGIEDMVFGEVEPGKKNVLRIFISDKNGILKEKKTFDLDFKYVRKKTKETFDVFVFNKIDVSDVDSDGKPEIIVIQNNSPFYVSCLRIFDLEGNEKFRFIHPGRLYVIHIMKIGNQKAIITGGANNYIHKFSLPVVVILKSNWKGFKNKILDWIQPENTNIDYKKQLQITYFTFFNDSFKVFEYDEALLSPHYKDNNKLVVSGIHYSKGDKKIVRFENMTFLKKAYICELVFDAEGKVDSKFITIDFIKGEKISSPETYVKKHLKIYYYDGQNWLNRYTKVNKPFTYFKKTF